MTKENKDILLKYLCMALPYNVYIMGDIDKMFDSGIISTLKSLDIERERVELKSVITPFHIDEVKPYLRPLSSMTEEEKKEMHNLLSPKGTAIYGYNGISMPTNHYGEFVPYEFMNRIIQYLLEHHFDFMGLIPKGIAIEAPKGMYEIKEK